MMREEEALTSVTGFSLQTNSTLSGGFISASGMSPIYVMQKDNSEYICHID